MSWIEILNPRSSHMEFVDTCLKDYMIPIWLLNAHRHLDLISCDCLWSSCQHVTHRKCRTDSQRRKTFLQFQQACSQRIPTTSGLKCKQILWQVKMCFLLTENMLGWCFPFMLLLNLFENLEDDLRLISHHCTPGEMEICSFHTNISRIIR